MASVRSGGFKRRAKGPRRKTGCYTCRARHIRCDETKPTCRNCLCKGYDCVQAEFVISNRGYPVTTNSELEHTVQPSKPAASSSSIREVFDQVPGVFHGSSAPADFVLEDFRPLDPETAELLRVFQEGIAAWLDLWDHSSTFSREAHRLAFASPLLREAICALSARHLDLMDKRNVWASVAARRYGASLRHLIAACDTDQKELLAATILLSCTELLSSPGPDHKKHLFGAATLIRSHKINATSAGLDAASFRVFIRQDLAVALGNRSPTMISPDDWDSSLPESAAEEDAFANHIVWLCIRAANFVFATHSACDSQNSDIYDGLMEDIDAWFDRLPQASRGVTYAAPDRHGFEAMWFPVPAAIVAMLTYHEAKLLLLGECLSASLSSDTSTPVSLHTQIQYHATRIGSIASSNIPDGAHVYSVQPLFYAAKYIDGLQNKARLWTLLSEIQDRFGFHTATQIEQLQKITEGSSSR